MIRETRPDVLITDIKMPFMDGLALSQPCEQGTAGHEDHHYQWI